jgi:hypothetical protein
MSSEFGTEERDVIRYAKQVGAVLLFGATVAALIVAARLFGGSEVKAPGIDVPLEHAWLLLVLVTVAHVFLGFFFYQSIHGLWRERFGPVVGRRVFDEIKIESNLFLRGMLPRSQPVRPGSRYYRMSWADPSTWVAHLALLVTVVALLPWHVEHGKLLFADTSTIIRFAVLVLFIVLINWRMGAAWSIGLSQLTVAENEAFWHHKKRNSIWWMQSGGV